MPLKGGPKDILANRNRKLGKIWKSLPNEHQEVFHPAVFYILSGLTPPPSDSNVNDDDDDDDEHGAVPHLDLEPEHRAELQALYDALVCKDKVAKEYAKVAAGMGQGPSLPDYNRQSQKCIERIHTQVLYFFFCFLDGSFHLTFARVLFRLKLKQTTWTLPTTSLLAALMLLLRLPRVYLDGVWSLPHMMRWQCMSINRVTLQGSLQPVLKDCPWLK